MAICMVAENPNAKQRLVLPVSGAGSNIPVGTLMMPGVTNNTNEGVAIPITATSNAYVLGVLVEKHNFSASGDATQATLVSWFPNGQLGSGNTQFPSREIELCDNGVILRVDYSLVSTVAVASATTTVLTITSEVAGLGGGFVYVNAGTGIGQLGFIKQSAAGSQTLTSALTTTLDSTSKLTKVLRHFYRAPIWLANTTTVPATLDSVAGNGSGVANILGAYMQRNNTEERIDPLAHHNLQKLNSLTTFVLYAKLVMFNTAFHSLS